MSIDSLAQGPSEDSIGFWGGDYNLGRYVGNEPTGWTDPEGMWGILDWLFGIDNADKENEIAGNQRADITRRLASDIDTDLDAYRRNHLAGPSATSAMQGAAQAGIETNAMPLGGMAAKPSLTSCKNALKKVQQEVGKLPKGKPGKFGSPQAGNPTKGYRLDPPHPNAPPGSPESQWYFNWWDWMDRRQERPRWT